MKKNICSTAQLAEEKQTILFTFEELLQKMRKSCPPIIEEREDILWHFKEKTRHDMHIIAKYAKEEGKREAARNMKKEGLRIDLIERCTAIAPEDIACL